MSYLNYFLIKVHMPQIVNKTNMIYMQQNIHMSMLIQLFEN